MKRSFSLLIAVCLLIVVFGVHASAKQTVVTGVASKEDITHTSFVYVGEISKGDGTVIKYVYSKDAKVNLTSVGNLSSALGAMDDKGFAELLTEHYKDLAAPAEGIKICSDAELADSMDDAWTSAKEAAAKLYPGAPVISEQNGELYDLDEKFALSCDSQEQKRKEEITYPAETGKRIINAFDVSSVDSVTYTVIDGELVKLVDTLVTYFADAVTVVYTSVKLESVLTVKPGDVDGNGNVDSTDYILIKRHILKVSELKGDAFKAADMDGSGKLDSTDYIAVKRMILGLA